jgi:type VI secretion system VasD/TssJ family lipoprotein
MREVVTMRKLIIALLMLGAAVSLGGCASSGRSADDWKYERDAILINMTSDPQLNLYQGKPHALVLCIYQLKDPNAFSQALDEREGLNRLLDCTRFDPSITHAKRVVAQPGKDRIEKLDRYEGSRFVGVIGGYYALERDTVARIIQIPRGGFFTSKPKVLDLILYLGPQELQEAAKQ